jgi:DNA polymerase-3 subunit delta
MAAAKTKPAAGATRHHAVLGSDDVEVKRVARELAVELAPAGGDEFAQEIIDGCAANSEEAAQRIHDTVNALLTFPFFGGEKLVWLKNANFLADNPMGRSAAVLEALEQLQTTLEKGVPDSVRCLFSATEVDKRRSFYKALSKFAKVEGFDRLDTSKSGWEDEAGILVRQLAGARGLKFDGDSLELFVLFTGGDRRVVASELEKLDLYLGPAERRVTEDHVRLLVPLSREGIIWDLGTALSERNVRRALGLLDQLLFQGETAIGILIVAIIPTVRNLLLVKDLMVRHRLSRPAQPFFFGKQLERLSPDAIAHLPRKKDGGLNTFPLGIAALHAARYDVPHLRKALDACLDANVKLVTSSLDAKTVLSQLVVRIAA